MFFKGIFSVIKLSRFTSIITLYFTEKLIYLANEPEKAPLITSTSSPSSIVLTINIHKDI
jgi:hypothetical protein